MNRQENKNRIAIVVVGYNRLDSLKRLLESIDKANYSNRNVPLVISIDASGNNEIYDFARSYDWKHGEKYTIIQEKRLGLRQHIFACGDLTKYFKAIILLEDDLFVSPFFYSFVESAVKYYEHDKKAACIGLYSYASNIYAALPFTPLLTKHDVYGIQATITWGECWTDRMWSDFKDWMNNTKEFDWDVFDIPENVKNFQRAWSKYFTAYLSVTGRFVIAPYKSYTTNFSEAGEHRGTMDTCVQVPYVRREENHTFGNVDDIVKYDSFFDPIGLEKYIGIDSKDLCIDFYSVRPNNRNCRYLLTTDILPFRCIKSYGLMLKPIECNVIEGIAGSGIFLYDLTIAEKGIKRDVNTFHSITYRLAMFRPRLLIKYVAYYITNSIFRKLTK